VLPGPRPAILHLDDDVVVIDKPSGQLSAAAPGQDRPDLASALEAELGGRIWVVQRLDFATSGVLLYARSSEANRELSRAIQARAIEREYLAVLEGDPELPEGRARVEAPVRGRPAVTHFTFVERIGPPTMPLATVTSCRLETGRTHQIRKHARRLGSFVLGDGRHGTRTNHDPPRLALHATRLALKHPMTGVELELRSDLPPDLSEWLATLRRF